MRIAIPRELEEYIRIKDEEIIEKKEIPAELKEKVQAFREEYAFELYKTKGKVSECIKGRIVKDLIRKVQELPYDTQFTIRELTNEFVDGKDLMDISSKFFSKIKDTTIELQCMCGEDEMVGLPYNIPYIKILDLDKLMDDFMENNSQISYEEYKKIFAKDENGCFINLIIPKDEENEELNLIGKNPSEFSVDEIIRMKKYSGQLYRKVNKDSINDYYDEEFIKYCKLYEERFGKHAYISEPGGTKEKTIAAIKICLERNEDILDKLLNLNDNQDFLY